MKNRWIPKSEVYIPPIKKEGFKTSVIIREYIPANDEKTEQDIWKQKNIFSGEDDEETVLLSEDYDGDEATVLLQEDVTLQIKHVGANEIIKINKDEFIIGKNRECDYVIKNNPTISRKHVRIYRENDEFWLADLNSSNHTYMEGQQISEPVRLHSGMRFQLSKDEVFEVLNDFEEML